jgi:hypothetical protein
VLHVRQQPRVSRQQHQAWPCVYDQLVFVAKLPHDRLAMRETQQAGRCIEPKHIVRMICKVKGAQCQCPASISSRCDIPNFCSRSAFRGAHES